MTLRFALVAVALAASVSTVDAQSLPSPVSAKHADTGPVTPEEFGFVGKGTATSVADTAAVQAAVNTGRPVDLSRPGVEGAIWVPSTCISLIHPGQEIYGSQRYADAAYQLRIQMQPGFPSCAGLFKYTGGEPAPRFHDLGVFYAQPDSPNVNAFINYPPMISAIGQPRGIADRIGCYGATVCFDLRGNSGGWSFNDVQLSAFKTNADLLSGTTYKTGMAATTGIGFRVDGAADTMRWQNIHIFPFAATAHQQSVLSAQDTSEPIGFQIGRCDGCYIDKLLNFNGLAILIAPGVFDTTHFPGAGFGEVSQSDFDDHNGIWMSAGNWKAVADDFNLARVNSQAILLTGGSLSVTASHIDIGVATNRALVQIDAAPNDYVSGIQFTGCSFDTADSDIFSIRQENGNLTLLGNTFSRAPGKSYVNPTIYIPAFGRVHAVANTMLVPRSEGKSGIFFDIAHDQYNRVIGNDGYGYSNVFPSGPLGIYRDN